ncbi:hypothetical protein LCGC14_0204670 [marine sediment metagenome]|uniref:Ice-binding protein C-terminal domain-containing protein n=1 Tax=marine sediment metagenome TaxID=412755 RepID=A0A0F9UM41_9ZZZZ|nr:PEP-CTERM sorting domain-containing protein [Phycisphaerae bacterium]HDZ45321.1 PEP-CTERM sorting domain-containing protein [Phycisphaerae bacterium]
MLHNYRALALVIVLALTAGLQASVVSYPLSIEFSGATPPAGAAPWLTAIFDDGGSPGSVDLTLTATNLVGSEFVNLWLFNLDPALNPTLLVFSAPSKSGSFTSPTISRSVDAFKADGDGWFDIKFDFASGGGDAARFGPGEDVSYTITGIGSLTAGSFDFLSKPGGGHGPFPTAAHVQGIGEDNANSGWITVPEPTSLALLGVGAIASLRRRRR